MAYRKKPRFKRRFGRRPRRRMGVYKGTGSLWRKPTNRAFFKLRSTILLTTNTLTGVWAPAFSVTNPQLWDGTNALPEWLTLTALYDRYRVTGVKLKYVPQRPFDGSASTGYYPIYTVYDTDDVTALGSAGAALEYDKVRTFNMYRPWQVYYRIGKNVNTAGAGVINVRTGMMDVGNPQTTGSIKQYFVGDLAKTYGTIVATYYITFSQRR